MLSRKQSGSRHALRKVVGLVLVVPLLVSLTPIPFGLSKVAVLSAFAASCYGIWFAKHNASLGTTVFATVFTLLNCASLVALSTPSWLMGLFMVSLVYGSGNWIHWRFSVPGI